MAKLKNPDPSRFEVVKVTQMVGMSLLSANLVYQTKWQLTDTKTGKVTTHSLQRHAFSAARWVLWDETKAAADAPMARYHIVHRQERWRILDATSGRTIPLIDFVMREDAEAEAARLNAQ